MRVGDIADLADRVSDALLRDDQHEALRWVAEFVVDVDKTSRDQRIAMLEVEPPPTGSPAWDALLAGLAEHLALRHGLSVPSWSLAGSRFLDTWWFFSDRPAWVVSAFTHAPAAFANRGVFIHAEALESV